MGRRYSGADGKAEAVPGMTSFGVAASEGLQHGLSELGGYPGSSVLDGQGLPTRGHDDSGRRSAVPQSVGQELPDEARARGRVSAHGGKVHDDHLRAKELGLAGEIVQCRADTLLESDDLRSPDVTGEDPVPIGIEQLLRLLGGGDELVQVLRCVIPQLPGVLLQESGEGDDLVQRALEVVREGSVKVVGQGVLLEELQNNMVG